jgi:LPS export ABC transporter protein LptC
MADATDRRAMIHRAVVAAALGLALVTGCGSDEDTVDTAPDVAAEIDTFTMDHYNGSELRWQMTGTRAQISAKGDTVNVDNPRVQLYDAGRPSLTITGMFGVVDKDMHDLTITESVRAVAPDGILLTEELEWDDSEGTLESNTDVELRRRGSVIYGSSMTSLPNLQQVHFLDVTFHLDPEDETIEPYPLDMPQAGANAR